MQTKLLIWGLGKDFQKLWPFYQAEMRKGKVVCAGGVDKNSNTRMDAFPVFCKEEIALENIDYLVISSSDHYWAIREEALTMGMDAAKIIDGRIFSVDGFDFCQFEQGHRLGERIFDGYFSDSSYWHQVRRYDGPGVEVTLGKKSYVGKSLIEHGDQGQGVIEIGHYTAIAWDIEWDLGLNLDHDYRRVSSYGVTHLPEEQQAFFPSRDEGSPKITVGSDVWIGKGSCIKSGVRIEDGAVVAAHSNVVCDVPAYTIVGGNPARFIKQRFSPDIVRALCSLSWWEWPEEKIHEAMAYFNDPAEFVRRYTGAAW